MDLIVAFTERNALFDKYMTPPCLQALLTDETISNVPVLILGNKIDRPDAISEDLLRTAFGLHGHTTGKVKNSCVTKTEVYQVLKGLLHLGESKKDAKIATFAIVKGSSSVCLVISVKLLFVCSCYLVVQG